MTAEQSGCSLSSSRSRIKAAAALHQHEPLGNWVECNGQEYPASKGCATLRALGVRPKEHRG